MLYELLFSPGVTLTFLLPTRMMGTLGQKCFTSGVHFSGMFSNESERERSSIETKVFSSSTW